MIRLVFFAQLAEIANAKVVQIAVSNAETVRDVAQMFAKRRADEGFDGVHDALFDGTVRVAINKKLADWDDEVTDGDEIAFLPPVSGG